MNATIVTDLPKSGAPVAVLDVDGVLLPFDRPEGGVDGDRHVWVKSMHGRSYMADFHDSIIDELWQILTDRNISIGWLTSWGPNVVPLIEQAFEGRLSGGFILAKRPKPYRGAVPIDWKYQALRAFATERPDSPIAWADDDAVELFLHDNPDTSVLTAAPKLLIDTDRYSGLTRSDLAHLENWAAIVR